MTREEAVNILRSTWLNAGRVNGKTVFAEALNMAIRALETRPEPKWIPCSDAPDTDRNVFIARGERDNMSVCIGHYSNEYKQWYEDKNWFGMLLYDGLYWCEIPTLPEPYRGEGD